MNALNETAQFKCYSKNLGENFASPVAQEKTRNHRPVSEISNGKRLEQFLQVSKMDHDKTLESQSKITVMFKHASKQSQELPLKNDRPI